MNIRMLSLALRLALNDVVGGAKKFRLFLACLTLGVGTIALIGSISESIFTGLSRDGQKLLGGDVAIRVINQDISVEQSLWLKRWGRLSRITSMRSMAINDSDDRTLINLKSVDNEYPLYGKVIVSPENALLGLLKRSGNLWGAVAQKSALTALNINIGDRVRVGNAAFEIRGVIKKEPDMIGGVRAITFGPRFLISEKGLRETGLVARGAQISFEYRVRLRPNFKLEDFRFALKSKFPNSGWRVRYSYGATRGLERFIERTTQFMSLVALTALLIGGVGAGNAARSYLNGKTEMIATLKCLGASQQLVFLIFVLEIVTMAIIGTCVGVIIGASLPIALGPILSDALGLPIQIGIYPSALFLSGAFGILITLMFSIIPLSGACRTKPAVLFRLLDASNGAPVGVPTKVALILLLIALVLLTILTSSNKEIALWFVVGAITAFAIFFIAGKLVEWLASQIKGIRRVELRMAIANLHRPGAPTVNIVLSVGVGLTVLVAILAIEVNIKSQLAERMPQTAPDFYFVDIQSDQVSGFDRIVKRTEGLIEFKRVPMLRGRIIKVNGVDARKVKVAENKRWVLRNDRGLTWSPTPPPNSNIIAGKWWPADYQGPPQVSFDADAATAMGVGIGDTLTVDILGRPLKAKISSLRKINWDNLGINFVLIFSPGIIQRAPQTHIATVKMRRGTATNIKKKVTDEFRNITAVEVRDVLDTVIGVFERIATAIRTAAGVTLLAGILVLGGAISSTTRQRLYDAVIMKVIGAKRRQVITMLLIEYSFIGAATSIIAATLGSIIGWAIITKLMRAEWLSANITVIITVVLATLFILFMGLIGMWKSLNESSGPSLKND